MKVTRRTALSGAALLLLMTCGVVFAKRANNRPYVQSGPDGAMYARCLPTSDEGTGGTTEVFMVGADADKSVDKYDWYAAHGVVLGWSPIAGKIAVMAAMNDSIPSANWKEREELRLCLGGKVLRSYTGAQLVALGAEEVISKPGGQHPQFRMVGCEQVPGTNEYDFILDFGDGKQVRLDILTGELRKAR